MYTTTPSTANYTNHIKCLHDYKLIKITVIDKQADRMRSVRALAPTVGDCDILGVAIVANARRKLALPN